MEGTAGGKWTGEERKKLQIPSSCLGFGKISLLEKSRARRG
jgi:hypothetical protein